MSITPEACGAGDYAVAENICRIVSNQPVNDEYRLLVADAPSTALTCRAGQFFQLLCASADGTGPLLRRPMSIYAVDRGRCQISFLYKVHGAGTRSLASLNPGEVLDALGPLGHGFTLPPGTQHVLLLARGVGLATLAPLAALSVKSGARVTAVLSARSSALVMSEAQLQEAGATTIVVTDEAGTSDVESLEARLRTLHAAHPFDFLATCGSNRLLLLLQQVGREWSIPGQVALEQHMACGLGMCFACVRPFDAADGKQDYRRVCWDGPVFDLQEALPW